VGARIGRIGWLHLSEPPDRNCDMRIGRGPQLVIEVDVGHLAVEFVLAAYGIAAAARGNLKVEVANQITVRARRPSLHEHGRGLQFVHRRRKPRNRRPRHADDKVRAKMSDQVLADERQGRKTGGIERCQSEPRVLDRAERHDHGTARCQIYRTSAGVDARDAPSPC
jgi:hypothetical protein